MLFVGSLYKSPDLYISFGTYIRSKYDFHDEATRFFYDCFENMYLNFSQTVDENKVNMFMSQDDSRLRQYRHYGGYKLLKKWMSLADVEDVNNYYDTVKKYSLIREYHRMGNPGEKILNYKKFDSLRSNDIYRLVRTNVDRINTVINANEESVDLSSGTEDLVNSYLEVPDMGLSFPWTLVTEMFRGMRTKKVVTFGYTSNQGKSRTMMLIAAYVVFIHNEKFFLMSNEMDEKDLRDCLLTTLINNEEFQKLHGVKMKKNEKEIVLGLYRDSSTNEFILRKQDDNGLFVETLDEYKQRLYQNSEEYRNVLKVAQWIDENTKGKFFFKDMGGDYSDKTIEFEMRKHRMLYGIKYMGYDTLKSYRTEEWQALKQTTTKLKELAKELDTFLIANFQLTDSTVTTNVFDLSSNNIANSKHLKHVVDHLILGKQIPKEEYRLYRYMPIGKDNVWGESEPLELDINKKYFALKIDKNRGGHKDFTPLLEIDLNINMWKQVGYLLKK